MIKIIRGSEAKSYEEYLKKLGMLRKEDQGVITVSQHVTGKKI